MQSYKGRLNIKAGGGGVEMQKRGRRHPSSLSTTLRFIYFLKYININELVILIHNPL